MQQLQKEILTVLYESILCNEDVTVGEKLAFFQPRVMESIAALLDAEECGILAAEFLTALCCDASRGIWQEEPSYGLSCHSWIHVQRACLSLAVSYGRRWNASCRLDVSAMKNRTVLRFLPCLSVSKSRHQKLLLHILGKSPELVLP